MADEKDVEKQADSPPDKTAQQGDKGTEQSDREKAPRRIMPLIIMIAAVLLFSGVGFALGRIGAAWRHGGSAESSPQDQSDQTQAGQAGETAADAEEFWYHNMDPVVANPDVPGATRYVRATLTLQIGAGLPKDQVLARIEKKMPIMVNWLNIFLKSLTLDDIRGNKNMGRIQMQILDAFNEQLFPDSKPQIRNILVREFAVQ